MDLQITTTTRLPRRKAPRNDDRRPSKCWL